MAKLLKKAGDFVLNIAAQQYKRSMTRKLNAFGEGKCDDRAKKGEMAFEICTHEAAHAAPALRSFATAAVARMTPRYSWCLTAH